MANSNCRRRTAAVAAGILVLACATRTAGSADEAHEFSTIAGANGVPLSVVATGNRAGRPVVFVHGIGQSYLAFENQLRSQLGQDLLLVAFDLRGHGNSGKPWTPDAYADRVTWAADLDHVIRGLGLKEPLLVGWSYGTLVVLDYLRVHGTRNIAGLVLTGSYGGLTKPGTGSPPTTPNVEFERLRADLASADLDRKWRAAHAMAKYLTARPMPASWMQRSAAISLLLPQSARAGMYQHPFDNTDLIPLLQAVPLLLVIGGKDGGTSTSDGRKLTEILPRARLEVFPSDGHSVFIESPQRFNELLSEFASTLERAGTPGAVANGKDHLP